MSGVRSGELRAHDRREADTSGAEDDHRVAQAGADDVAHHADTGDDGAARDGGDLRRDVVGHPDDAALGHDDALREAGDAEQVVHRLAVGAHARRAVEQAAGAGLHGAELAHDRPARDAVLALPAVGPPEQGDAVADRDVAAGAFAELDDPARALVAGDHRQRALQIALEVVQVGVAHPGRLDLDQDLAVPRGIELDLLDLQGRAELAQYCRAHQCDSRMIAEPVAPTRKSRSAPESA